MQWRPTTFDLDSYVYTMAEYVPACPATVLGFAHVQHYTHRFALDGPVHKVTAINVLSVTYSVLRYLIYRGSLTRADIAPVLLLPYSAR